MLFEEAEIKIRNNIEHYRRLGNPGIEEELFNYKLLSKLYSLLNITKEQRFRFVTNGIEEIKE